MITIIFFCLLTWFITITVGLIIIKLFRMDINSSIILLSPLIGVSSIIIFSQNLGLILPGKIVSIILGILIIASIYFLRFDLKDMLKQISSFFSSNKLVAFFCLMALLISAFPLLYTGYLTAFNAYNSDLIVYLTNPILLNKEAYLFSNTFGNDFPLYQFIGSLIHVYHERIGFDYFTMNLMNLTGLESYQLVFIEACFIYSLFPVTIYFFVKKLFNTNRVILGLVLALSTLSPIMLRALYSQFFPQILGIVFSITFCALLYDFLTDNTKAKSIPLIIIISGAVAVYPEISIYFAIYGMVLVGILLLNKKVKIKNTINNLIKIVFFALILNISATVIMLYKQFAIFKATQGGVGNIQVFVPWGNYIGHMLGIKSSLLEVPINGIISSILILAFLIFLLTGVMKSTGKTSLISLIGVSLVLFVYFRYINQFPYGVYKHIVSAEWIFLIFVGFGLGFYLTQKPKGIIRYISLTSLGIVLTLNMFSIYKIYKDVITQQIKIDHSFIELSEIKNLVPRNEAILLKTDPYIETHNVLYFLKDRKVSLSNASYLGDYQSTPSNGFSQYTLMSSSIHDIFNSGNREIIWQNNRFALVHESGEDEVFFAKGFYDVESAGGNYWRWLDGEAVFNVRTNNDKNIKLSFTVNTIAPTSETEVKTCKLFLDNQYIGTFVGDKKKQTEVVFDNISLKSNQDNNFKIVVNEGADVVPNDTRKLSISISNMKIENM